VGIEGDAAALAWELLDRSAARHSRRSSDGASPNIRSDNGPEFIAEELRKWLGKVGTRTLYIETGNPWENGYCESFNGKLRDDSAASLRLWPLAANGDGRDRDEKGGHPGMNVRRSTASGN
jgi:transposase InsO family protein